MSTVVITGGTGLLGFYLAEQMVRDHCVICISPDDPEDLPKGVYHQLCDVTRFDDLDRFLREIKPSIVFNTADFNDLDLAEERPGKAFDLNVKSVFFLARLAAYLRFKLVHFSSDFVFDGRSGPYEERDPVGRLNFYGETKQQAEEVVQYLVQEYLIIRTSFLYGDGRTSHTDFIKETIEKLEAGKSFKVEVDQWMTPTSAEEVARSVVTLVEKDMVGLFHIAGSDLVSKNYFAHTIAELLGYNRRLITAATTHFMGYKAARPERGGLRSVKLKTLLGHSPGGIREGLQKYAQR